MLTESRVNSLADQLNSDINLPILGEKAELKLLKEFVRKADAAFKNELSSEVYGYINNADAGIPDEQLGEVREQMLNALQKKVNIPLLKGVLKESLYSMFTDKMVDALQVGNSID
ncbi:MAG: hypothetical protein ACPGJS_15070 [Flammeovirgaceae bacterium]